MQAGYKCPERVLVIDAESFMRRLIRSILKDNGVLQVEEAGDGKTAIKKMKDLHPDMIIMEADLEDGPGTKFLKLIRLGKAPVDRDVRAIIISARRDMGTIQRSMASGLHAFVSKPFSAEQLMQKVDAAMRDQREFVETVEYCGPDRRRRYERRAKRARMPHGERRRIERRRDRRSA